MYIHIFHLLLELMIIVEYRSGAIHTYVQHTVDCGGGQGVGKGVPQRWRA